MKYEQFSILRDLIEQAKKDLHQDYLKALHFIPVEPYHPTKKSAASKACDKFTKEYAVWEELDRSLFSVVQASYKDHPSKEMRQFWQLE